MGVLRIAFLVFRFLILAERFLAIKVRLGLTMSLLALSHGR